MNLTLTKSVLSPLSLLLIPLFGNIFSNQVNWSLFDFIIMGLLFGMLGIIIHCILEKVSNKIFRIVPIIFVLITFLMIWAELAVGIFGSLIAGG